MHRGPHSFDETPMSTTDKIRPTHVITSRIIDALAEGTVPWQKPWVTGVHRNATSGRSYRGANVLALEFTALERGYASPGWVTYRQAHALGGYVRQGEPGTLVTYFERLARRRGHCPPSDDPESDDHESLDDTREWFFLARGYYVFNIEQCEGLDALHERIRRGRSHFEPIEAAQQILDRGGVPVKHGGGRACYDPNMDEIALPHPTAFHRREAYSRANPRDRRAASAKPPPPRSLRRF